MRARGLQSGRARRALSTAAGLAAACSAGCSLLSSFDGLTGGPACDGEDYIDTCAVIPRAPAGLRQVVDGDGAELCEVESDLFDPAEGHYRTKPQGSSRCPPPDWLTEAAPSAVIRAAWSEAALHVHVRVDKATAIAPGEADALFSGDAVEIFVGNTEAPTGPLPDDHAGYVIVAPPREPGGAGASASGVVTRVASASRRDDAGYDVELEIPWSSLGGEPPAEGRTVLWNVGIDVAGDEIEPGGQRARFQSFLHYEEDGKARFCRYDDPEDDQRKPSRDDRSWCRARLGP